MQGSLSTPLGRSMAAEVSEFERALIDHLRGKELNSFEALDARRKELKARIDAAGLAPGDKKRLDDRLARAASVIARGMRLAGGASALAPAVSKAVASAVVNPAALAKEDPLYLIDALLGDLGRAADNPAEADNIFDNLRRHYGKDADVAANIAAIRKQFGEREPTDFTPAGAPGTNAAKRKTAAAVPNPAASDFTAPGAIDLYDRHVALEKNILAYLTAGAFAFEELVKELEILKTELGSAQEIPAAERAALTELLLRDERLLTGGAALARGAGRLDARLEKILLAAADSNRQASAASVDAVVSQLLSAAAARDPEQAGKVFDNLRASLRADAAVSADLDAVKADFARRGPIVYTPLGDVRKGDAVENCQEALNGSSVGGACKHNGVGASTLAGIFDAVRQQFGTLAGLMSNVAAVLLGLLFGLLTGGVGLLIKILLAVGMTLWALYELLPAFVDAFKAFRKSKKGSIEYYAAIRQLSALSTGLVIMGLLAVLGGKIGKATPEAWEAAVAGVSTKVASKIPTGISNMFSKWNPVNEAKMASPKMEGTSRVPDKSEKTPAASAVHSAGKGYVLVAEESGAAAQTGNASRLVEKTIIAQLEKELASGAAVSPARARAVLTAALAKADLALRKYAAANPTKAAQVDLSVGIVAKDAAGRSVLVSAKTGGAEILLRRGGQIVVERPAIGEAALSGRAARIKVGIKNLAAEWWSDVRGVKPTARPQTNLAGNAGAPRAGALGSPGYKTPLIQELALRPKDVVLAASSSADGVAAARAVAELRIPRKRGFLPALAEYVGSREINYRANVFAASQYVPSPLPKQPDFSEPPPAPPIEDSDSSKDKANEKKKEEEQKEEEATTIVPDRPRREDSSDVPVASGGGPVAGSGGEEGKEGSGEGPQPPKFGGFGDGGGGAGGGGGGAGGDGMDGGGAGGEGPEIGGNFDGGARPSSGDTNVSAAEPDNLRGGGPADPVKRGAKVFPDDVAADPGGHLPFPSLASGYDGSRNQPASASNWSPTAMQGLGAGDSPALPRLTAREPALAAPASYDDGLLPARQAGGPAASAGSAPGVKPEDEDYSYTYMAPARHKYELPVNRPADERNARSLLALGLPGAAAALAVAYLSYHSDLPYLLGFTRRRRDGTYGA